MSKYGVFSGPYFPEVGLNTERLLRFSVTKPMLQFITKIKDTNVQSYDHQLQEIQQSSCSTILQLERFCADNKIQKCIFYLQQEVITIKFCPRLTCEQQKAIKI